MKTAHQSVSISLVWILIFGFTPAPVAWGDNETELSPLPDLTAGENLKSQAPQEVVVKLVDAAQRSPAPVVINTAESEGEKFARQEDLEKKAEIPEENLVVLATGTKNPEQVADELKKNPQVEWAEPNHHVYADFVDAELEWNIGGSNAFGVNANPVWKDYTGTGVIVAVLDTGIDLEHSDLKDNIWTNPGEICANGIDDEHNGYIDDCHGWDFVGPDVNNPVQDNNPDAGHWHGTHVAGIIAAEDNNVGVVGVAPKATLMPVKILDDGTGGAPGGDITGIISGIEYAVNNGADVINMSFGSTAELGPEVAAAIKAASDKGVVLVASAGNSGLKTPNYPASYPEVIAVGASGPDGAIASFSSTGYVDFVAPGTAPSVTADPAAIGIRSTYPENRYARSAGTSMAAPHVSGVVALYLQANPSANPTQVEAALLKTALDLGAPGKDDVYGNGLINAFRPLSPPLLTQVASQNTNLNAPVVSINFQSTEAGTLATSGACGHGSITTAVLGQNTIDFSGLAEKSYSDCKITVTDSQGQVSVPLQITPFTIDRTPPSLSIPSPSSGSEVTGENVISLTGNEEIDKTECALNATDFIACVSGTTKFSALPGWANVFAPAPSPSPTATSAADGFSAQAVSPSPTPDVSISPKPFTLHVRAQDKAGNSAQIEVGFFATSDGNATPTISPTPNASVAATATPSVSPTPSASPTPTPILSPTPTPSPPSSVSPTPTSTPTPAPTQSPSNSSGGGGGGGGTSSSSDISCKPPQISGYLPAKDATISTFPKVSFIASEDTESVSLIIVVNGKRLPVTVTKQSDNRFQTVAEVPPALVKKGENKIDLYAGSRQHCNGNSTKLSYSVTYNGSIVATPSPTSVSAIPTPEAQNLESSPSPTAEPLALPEPSAAPRVYADSADQKGSLWSDIISFPDTVGHWGEQFIVALAERHVVSGYGNGNFGPDNPLTRAEAVKIGLNAFGFAVPAAISSEKPFPDIDTNAWYATFVEAAADNAVVTGFADGSFRPDEKVTRAEALKIIVAASKTPLTDPTSLTLEDAPRDVWFIPYVAWAVSNHVVNGYADGNFKPNDPVTRAEFAKMTYLTLVLMGKLE